MTETTSERLEWRRGARGTAYSMEYSLKRNEGPSRYTDSLGYFHGFKIIVFAESPEAAVELLQKWHDDGKVEGVKCNAIGTALK